ncbi:MAG: phosphoribosylanthranilate isomerase [Candidatus Dormibacteria bacterium]
MTAPVLVKICGTTSVEDALLAVAAGADRLGVIFAESPRRVTPARAREIAGALPPGVDLVGVFVDADADEINRVVDAVGLSRVQLSGDEDPDLPAQLSVPAIKVLHVQDRLPAGLEVWAAAEAVMLDTWDPSRSGGTGRAFPWHLAAGLSASARLWVSGGLDQHNVASAIGALRPLGVDVCSGVEAEPGRKDPHQVRRFVAAVRRLERMGSSDPLAGEEVATEDYLR